MNALTAEAIFHARDLDRRERVDLPDWGGFLYVRQVTAGERDEFESRTSDLRDKKKPLKARARFAIMVCCDAEGRPVFEDKHLNTLNEKSGAMLDRIWEEGTKLNAWLRGKEELDELEKNSEGTDDSDSE